MVSVDVKHHVYLLSFSPQIDTHLTASALLFLWLSVHVFNLLLLKRLLVVAAVAVVVAAVVVLLTNQFARGWS